MGGCRDMAGELRSRKGPAEGSLLGRSGPSFFCYINPFGLVNACPGPSGNCIQLSSENHHLMT